MNQRLQMSILRWLNQVIMLLPVFLISYTTMHSAQMFGPAQAEPGPAAGHVCNFSTISHGSGKLLASLPQLTHSKK